MFFYTSIIKKILTTVFLGAIIFSSFGVKANATYFTPIVQPNCANDFLGRVLYKVLYQGYSSCDYNRYNQSCNQLSQVGKITGVFADQNTTPTNDVVITVNGKISSSCDTNPVKVYVNVTDQNGNYLINNDSQYINANSNCSVNTYSYDCTNFTIQIQAQKSDFINKSLKVELSFYPKNNYNYYVPFENSNIFILEPFRNYSTYSNYSNNYYDCNLYNNCIVNYPIFGGITSYEAITPNIPVGCQLNTIDYYYDNCYFI